MEKRVTLVGALPFIKLKKYKSNEFIPKCAALLYSEGKWVIIHESNLQAALNLSETIAALEISRECNLANIRKVVVTNSRSCVLPRKARAIYFRASYAKKQLQKIRVRTIPNGADVLPAVNVPSLPCAAFEDLTRSYKKVNSILTRVLTMEVRSQNGGMFWVHCMVAVCNRENAAVKAHVKIWFLVQESDCMKYYGANMFIYIPDAFLKKDDYVGEVITSNNTNYIGFNLEMAQKCFSNNILTSGAAGSDMNIDVEGFHFGVRGASLADLATIALENPGTVVVTRDNIDITIKAYGKFEMKIGNEDSTYGQVIIDYSSPSMPEGFSIAHNSRNLLNLFNIKASKDEIQKSNDAIKAALAPLLTKVLTAQMKLTMGEDADFMKISITSIISFQ